MKEKTIKLDYPVTITNEGGAEVVVEELTLKRVKTKQLKKVPKACFTEGASLVEIVPLIATVCRVEENVIDELDITDLTHIGEELQTFLVRSPKTGKK